MATYASARPYSYGTGRRKSSVARVHLMQGGTGSITINGRDIDDYFGLETLKRIVRQPLTVTETTDKVDIVATVMKAAGLLTRDPRMKERKKYGLKAARRAPQFSKR